MVPHFLRTLLQRGAKLSVWTRLTDVEVELLRCHHPARCSHAGCGGYRATTIVRYLDAKGRPLHQIAEVCNEHADLIKGLRANSRAERKCETSEAFRRENDALTANALARQLETGEPLIWAIVCSERIGQKFSRSNSAESNKLDSKTHTRPYVD